MKDTEKDQEPILERLKEEYHLEDNLLSSILLADLSDEEFWPEPVEISRKERTSLNPVNIIPGQGEGNLSFGMSRQQAEKRLGEPAMEDGENCYYEMKLGSGCTALVYQLLFQENQLTEITLYDSLKEDGPVLWGDVEVFSEKAEDVIAKLQKKAECRLDHPDPEQATECRIDSMGLTLWRERAFSQKEMSNPDFLKMEKDEQEYEKSFWHFASVTIKA